MEKVKNSMTSFAMQAGLGLGGFWVFKYLFIIGATKYPSLNFVSSLLSFVTPLLLLFYLVQFKNITADKELKYWMGVKLGILLFFFASIIESAIIIVHIVWIDPSYISFMNEQTIELGKSLNFNETMMGELIKQGSFSPYVFVFRHLMSNVFLGFLLSLMISPIASRIKIDIKVLDK